MQLYKRYIVLIIVLAVILNWVVEGNNSMGKADMNLGLFPKFAVVVIEFLQAVILVRLLLLYPNNNFLMATIVGIAVFCGFELLVIKSLRADMSVWVAGIRYYFSFVPLFLLSYFLASKGYSIKQGFNWLIALILLQIPVATYQFMNLSSVTITNDRQLLFDMISGTMGGIAPNLMSLLIGIGLLYFLIRFIEDKKIKFLFVALALLAPPVLAEAKGMLLVIFIVLGYLAIAYKFNLTRIFVMGVAGLFLLFGFSYVYELLGYGDTLSISFLIEYANNESGSGRLSRIDSIVNGFNILLDQNALLFGMGIGNANKNPLGHDGQYYDFYTIRHSIDILVTETGLLGIVFLTMFLANLFRMTKSLLQNQVDKLTKEDATIIRVFQGTLYIFVFGMLWVDALYRIQFMYPFGLMAGYTIGLYNRIKLEGIAPPYKFNQLKKQTVL